MICRFEHLLRRIGALSLARSFRVCSKLGRTRTEQFLTPKAFHNLAQGNTLGSEIPEQFIKPCKGLIIRSVVALHPSLLNAFSVDSRAPPILPGCYPGLSYETPLA